MKKKLFLSLFLVVFGFVSTFAMAQEPPNHGDDDAPGGARGVYPFGPRRYGYVYFGNGQGSGMFPFGVAQRDFQRAFALDGRDPTGDRVNRGLS